MTTRLGDEVDHGVHAIAGNQRPRMPAMSGLTARLASAFPAATPFTLLAGQAVGGRRLRCRRRVLLPKCELSFEIGNPLLLLAVLLPESFVFLPQALNLTRPTSGLIDIATRTIRFRRRPASGRHAGYGTPIASTCTDP